MSTPQFCPHCGQKTSFENASCTSCGVSLGPDVPRSQLRSLLVLLGIVILAVGIFGVATTAVTSPFNSNASRPQVESQTVETNQRSQNIYRNSDFGFSLECPEGVYIQPHTKTSQYDSTLVKIYLEDPNNLRSDNVDPSRGIFLSYLKIDAERVGEITLRKSQEKLAISERGRKRTAHILLKMTDELQTVMLDGRPSTAFRYKYTDFNAKVDVYGRFFYWCKRSTAHLFSFEIEGKSPQEREQLESILHRIKFDS